MHLKLIRRVINHIELIILIILSYIFGINYIIKYLRNPNPSLSIKVIRYYGGKIGDGTSLKRGLQFDNVLINEGGLGNFSNLKIGNNVYIGDNVYFDLADQITIEDDVVISPHCNFTTHQNCENTSKLSKAFKIKKKPVLIKKGVWIATGACIFYSTVNENSLISAKVILINDNIPPDVIVKSSTKIEIEEVRYENSNKIFKK